MNDTTKLTCCAIRTNTGVRLYADMTSAQMSGFAPADEIVFAYADVDGEIVAVDVPMYAVQSCHREDRR